MFVQVVALMLCLRVLCTPLLLQVIEDPILAFAAEGEINQLQWDASHEDWVAICFKQCVQVLKV